MTPQEKASELIDKFQIVTGDDFDTLKRVSKACAIICVEEIIKAQPCIDFWDSSTGPELRLNTGYWNEVLSILRSRLAKVGKSFGDEEIDQIANEILKSNPRP